MFILRRRSFRCRLFITVQNLTASHPAKIRQKYGGSHTGSRIFRPKKHKNTAVNTAIATLLAELKLKIRPGGSYLDTCDGKSSVFCSVYRLNFWLNNTEKHKKFRQNFRLVTELLTELWKRAHEHKCRYMSALKRRQTDNAVAASVDPNLSSFKTSLRSF